MISDVEDEENQGDKSEADLVFEELGHFRFHLFANVLDPLSGKAYGYIIVVRLPKWRDSRDAVSHLNPIQEKKGNGLSSANTFKHLDVYTDGSNTLPVDLATCAWSNSSFFGS